MTRSYKGFRIETITRADSGKWKVWAKITPDVPDFHTIRALTMSKNGCSTRQEAENSVWEDIKSKIDELIR